MLSVLQQPGTIDLFGVNPRILKILSGTPEQPNHRIEVTLQRQGAAGFVDIPGAVMSSPLYSQQATFNLSKRLPFKYNLPEISTDFAVQLANEMGYRWKAIIKEYYGAPPLEQSMTLAMGCAMYGGVDRIKARTYNFLTDFITGQAFLTNQPSSKLIDRLQPDWLYYPHLQDAYNSADVVVDLKFSDGTTDTFTKDNFSLEKGLVYIIPTGYFQLGLAEYEQDNRIIVSYKVRVVHAPGQEIGEFYESQSREYIIDFDEQSWDKRFFIFRNQLGGMDVVCSRGKREKKKTASMNTRTSYWTGEGAASSHHLSNINSIGKHETKQNVGWLDKDTRSWLGGLIGSGLAWEIIDYQFVPIRVTSTSAVIDKDDESLQDFVFDFEYTENEMI